VKRASFLKRLYLKHFAKPVAERVLFSAIADGSVRQIVEIGLGDCSRAARLIELAIKCQRGPISYCGIDLFEATPSGKSMVKFKDAYCKLNVRHCKPKLVPGEPTVALSRCANSLTKTDLLLISNQFDLAGLAPMWMYVPRMLTLTSRVFLQDGAGEFEQMPTSRINSLAELAVDMRRKSA
jgi:hypothetical protein